MGAKVKDIDKGYTRLVKAVFGLKKPKISVGVFSSETEHDSTLSVLDVAIINEFGLGVPERSFLRAWFDQNEDRSREMVRVMMASVLQGKRTKEQALQILATKFVSEIQQRIANKGNGDYPANAPSTVAKKGSSTPLIDVGQLRSSISWKIDLG